jgi:hypothetical protein
MHVTRSLIAMFAFVTLVAAPAWAGPPLICHTNDIGSQHSLPWLSTNGWNGADPAYDLSRLTGDTLALLAPGTPVVVRMETLRRAAIYSARQTGLSDQITIYLLSRVASSELSGKQDPYALFDAGYFIETLREAALVYPMLHGTEHDAWMIRTVNETIDGLALIRAAVRMGGTDMQPALAVVERSRAYSVEPSAGK